MSRDLDRQVVASVSVVLPVQLEIDGCTVTLLEVRQYTTIDRKRRYLVSCRARCGNRTSQTFFLDVESNSDLLWKLKVELSKFRLVNTVVQ